MIRRMSATRTRASRQVLTSLLTAALLAGGAGRAAEPAKKASAELICPEGMVLIPGGSFPLGGKKMVKVKAFCLDETEVTAGAYEKCVDKEECSSGYEELARERDSATYKFDSAAPINWVTWRDARQYCESEQKRLPTEAEWEWAARGGPAGNPYPWGNHPPSGQACWSRSASDASPRGLKRPCPVTEHAGDATPQGIRGLAGNVAEWTATRGDETGEYVLRGGWYDARKELVFTATFRESEDAKRRSPYIGFRCAQDPDR
jgi:formylglycine-generating enzyme required for sulfatase activity